MSQLALSSKHKSEFLANMSLIIPHDRVNRIAMMGSACHAIVSDVSCSTEPSVLSFSSPAARPQRCRSRRPPGSFGTRWRKNRLGQRCSASVRDSSSRDQVPHPSRRRLPMYAMENRTAAAAMAMRGDPETCGWPESLRARNDRSPEAVGNDDPRHRPRGLE